MSKNISRRRFLNLFALADAITEKVEELPSYASAPDPEPEAIMYNTPASHRSDILINTGWKFNQGDIQDAQQPVFDDSEWSPVTLPHTWNNIDGENEETYYRGGSWYRLDYIVPFSYEGQRLYLQFDGASLVADVYVNGMYLGEHRGGYGTFRFDATSALTVGEKNVIAVRVDNSYTTDIAPLNGDFTVFGGLYRAVHPLAVDEVHVNLMDYGSSGLFLRQEQVSTTSADLHVTVAVRNESTSSQSVMLNTFLVDEGNVIVQILSSTEIVPAHGGHTFMQTMIIGQPHLWDKANWTTEPFVYITARRFDMRTEATTDIKVYANTSVVTLILNGVPLDTQTSSNHIFAWEGVVLQTGSNVVEVVGTEGNETCNDIVTWDVQ